MKIYIVYADDHDYDAMSYWFSEKAFTCIEEAHAEARKMEESYKELHGVPPPTVEVFEFDLTITDEISNGFQKLIKELKGITK